MKSGQNKNKSISLQNCNFIKFLINQSESEIRSIVKNLPLPLINILSEITLNCLSGNITKNKNKIKILKPYSSVMKAIANRKNSYKHRKSLLSSKKGAGFLSILLPLAISAISSLTTSKK